MLSAALIAGEGNSGRRLKAALVVAEQEQVDAGQMGLKSNGCFTVEGIMTASPDNPQAATVMYEMDPRARAVLMRAIRLSATELADEATWERYEIDSLDVVDLIIESQAAFGISTEQESLITECKTLPQLCTLLQSWCESSDSRLIDPEEARSREIQQNDQI